MKKSNHIWSFSTVGGVKRVNLESGEDLVHLGELDQKLWTALSCPVNGLEIDSKTLSLIDLDNDGQIRVPEILAAVSWITSILKNPNDLLKQEAIFPLTAINDETEEGKTLLASARIILKSLGKEDSSTLTVEETSDTSTIFSNSAFSGDGIITQDTATNPEVATLLNDMITCVGAIPDRGGKMGISVELLQQFMESCALYSSWYAKSETNDDILVYGELSEEAFLCYTAIKSKVDDFFIRCRLAAFDSVSTDALNISAARVEAISPMDLSVSINEIAEYPIAKIEAGRSLPLSAGINPAWQNAVDAFNKFVASISFPGKQALTETEWNSLAAKFASYTQWKSEKEGAIVEPLGPSRVKEILNSPYVNEMQLLMEADKALEDEANSIILVDKLVRYYRDLFALLKNFVTFYDFYSPEFPAVFQAGTLYIDQRSCDLCIKVSNMDKHNTMVSYSGIFLIYCECTSRSTNETMTIAAALTNGDIDNLVEGRNAVFYDRNGLDWDATVIKIIDNPISIRQAFFSPYRKVSRFIEKQVNKVAAEQDEKVHSNATKNIEETQVKIIENKVTTPAQPKAPAPPFDIGKFVGIFAAISLALGAIGTAIASVIAGFMGLTWWKMPFAIAGMLLLISGPSMVMAYLKLRKRNLAPILDANGWAINANIIVNIPFGNTLTHLAQLPPGSKINLNDPFTKKKRPFLPYAVAGILLLSAALYLLWKYGHIHINI